MRSLSEHGTSQLWNLRMKSCCFNKCSLDVLLNICIWGISICSNLEYVLGVEDYALKCILDSCKIEKSLL